MVSSRLSLSAPRLTSLFSAAFLALTLTTSPTLASPIAAPQVALATPTTTSLPAIILAPTGTLSPGDIDSYFSARLAIDNVEPTKINGAWTVVPVDSWDELRRRDNSDESSSSASAEESSSSTSAEESTSTSASETSSETSSSTTWSSTSSTASSTALPKPMDQNLSYNFTTNGGKSCPAYLNALLDNETFKACYPISMLLKGSSSFFQAQKELQSLVSVLDATCAADYDSCATYLHQERVNLANSSNCAEEYVAKDSNVMLVYNGLAAFEPLYKATCVRDPDTSMYCYASAITNSSNTGNAYTYYMPLNSSFPSSAEPTCTTCLQETMSVFRTFTNDAGLPLAGNYADAAEIINGVCGEGFVNETVRKITEDSSEDVGKDSTGSSATSGVMRKMPWSTVALGGLFAMVLTVM